MLSAIAARKAAAKAVADQVSSTSFSKAPSPSSRPNSPSQSPGPTKNPKPDSKPTSKRKPSSVSTHAGGPSKNKKVKVAHAPARHDQKRTRYFHPGDSSSVRSGSTVDESTSRAGSGSDSDPSSEDEMMQIGVPPVEPSPLTVTKANRAWSPSRPFPDSSDDEKPGPSTFRPEINRNVYLVPENAVVLVLQPNERVALAGVYSLCVLQGNLSLLGATLSPSITKYTVFAPRSSPIPILSWAKSDHQDLCTFPIPPSVQQQSNTTIILVEYARTGVEGLGRICKVFENVFKPPRESVAVPDVNPRIHIVNNAVKDVQPFVVPRSWETALAAVDEDPDSEMSAAPVYLVKGPKKSGKSTLARTFVNRLLNRYRRVAFLECDLGQSEFTPGGSVALNVVENYVFGPPFTHPSVPYRAHYIGSASPRACPSQYLRSIQSLLETYRLDLQFRVSNEDPPSGDDRIYDTVPLVVNTMGWTKGLGADLNAKIQDFVEASHTFDIDGPEEKGWPAPSPSERVPQPPTVRPFTQAGAKRSFKIEAIQTESTNTYQTATDHRHLNILSYFHAVFPEPPPLLPGSICEQVTATSWDTSLPLCAQYPYEVDTKAFDHVYLTGPGYEDVVPSELTRVLNGAIVGLVSVGPARSISRPFRSMPQDSYSLSYTPDDPPPDPAHSTCYGLALIRGMPLSPNSSSPHMHVLTPLPASLLAQTRVLVKGEMELPIWGMLDFREEDEGEVAGVERGQVPHLQWGKGEGIGSEKRRARRNLMRKGQM